MVYLVHLVLRPEEHILVLVLVLELEALRPLRQASVHIVQQRVVVGLHLRVLSPLTNRFWKFVGNLVVGVADLFELGGIKLAQGLAQQILIPPRNVSISSHAPECEEHIFSGFVEEGLDQLKEFKLAKNAFQV